MSAAPPFAGVIGWPVGHSRSPALFRFWLDRHRLAGGYGAFAAPPEGLEAALVGARALGFAGLNVTLPHKEAALRLADRASARARRVGAANTLAFTRDGIEADVTDGFGFLENLRQARPGWTAGSGPALLLGAGGAARAAAAALLDDGAPELRVANRTRARAEALAEALDENGRVRVVPWEEAESAMEGAAVLVNATSLGMAGQPSFTLRLDAASPGAVATDLVYAPLETPFLKAAARRGLVTVDGLGMLLHQARPGFERWFGVSPRVDEALRRAVLAA